MMRRSEPPRCASAQKETFGSLIKRQVPSLIPTDSRPSPFVEIIKDHLCGHLCDGDGASDLRVSCEDQAQHEGVHAASNPPADRLSDGSRVGVASANEW